MADDPPLSRCTFCGADVTKEAYQRGASLRWTLCGPCCDVYDTTGLTAGLATAPLTTAIVALVRTLNLHHRLGDRP